MHNEQSVEEWAKTAEFTTPLQYGEVEAGVLAREPVSAGRMELWMPLLTVGSWAVFGFVYILGLGATVLGMLFVWLGTRQGGGQTWLDMAQVVFVGSAFVEICLLFTVAKSRRREGIDWGTAVVVVAACAVAYLVLREASDASAPALLSPAIIGTGAIACLVLVASLVGKPYVENTSKTPPQRGPKDDIKRYRYTMSRERVLDILVKRGLVKIDEADRLRLREMPLGYWEELDNIDERERRRILEYRLHGWREFTESDRRAWSPPEKTNRKA